MLGVRARLPLSPRMRLRSRSRSIRVAVEGAYPPFNFIDANNELQGFEVDLLKSLCEAMNGRHASSCPTNGTASSGRS